jgi:PKD domain
MKRRNMVSKKNILLSIFGCGTLVVGIIGFSKANASFIQDCSPNSIITCGAQDPSTFAAIVKSNNDKSKHKDLQAIFTKFGLESTNLDQFVTSAQEGVAKTDGTVIVNGRVVASDAWSIGRTHYSFASPYNIGGKTYWKSLDTDVLKQNLPVMVMFNSRGQMQFAVMNACGNPIKAKTLSPKFSCDLLQEQSVKGMANTYDFTTRASASAGAKVVKVTYDFGDGSSNVVANSLSQKVRHTFNKPGTWTIRVSVTVSLPGNQTVTVTSASCQKQVTVAQPFFQCVSLTPYILDQQMRRFRFIVKTNQGNGATLASASFNFGDGNSAGDVNPITENSVQTDHTYANDGNFAITATVNFNTQTGLQSVNCVTSISPTVTPPPPPAVTPTSQLINTGPGATVSLFLVSSVLAGFVFRLYLGRRLKN